MINEKLYKLAFIRGFPNLAEYIRTAIPEDKIPTCATNGYDIFYNPEFVTKTPLNELLGVMMHEYYHIIYEHVQRRGNRNPLLWNVAADCVINQAVIERCGMVLPTNLIYRGKGVFEDLPDNLVTTVAIYDWLMQKGEGALSELERMIANEHLTEQESLPEGPTSPEAKARAERNKQAGQACDKSEEMKEVLCLGKSDGWVTLIDAMRIESGRLVHRTHTRSYQRPARYEPEGLIRPCFNHWQHHPKIDVYIDVSGSMGDLPNSVLKGLRGVLSHTRLYRPTFYSFDTSLRKIDINQDKLRLGGGTDIKKVLDKIYSEKTSDLAILVTDCEDNISVSDIKNNVIVVSNNTTFADYHTTDFTQLKKRKA